MLYGWLAVVVEVLVSRDFSIEVKVVVEGFCLIFAMKDPAMF